MTEDHLAELKRLADSGVCDCDRTCCVCELVALQHGIRIAIRERRVMLAALKRAQKHLSERHRRHIDSAIAIAESSEKE